MKTPSLLSVFRGKRIITAISVLLYSLAQAQVYVFRDLYTLGIPAGLTAIQPTGITTNGDVVGYGSKTDQANSTVFWSTTNPNGTNLTPGDYGWGISASHQTGSFVTSSFQHAALWNGSPNSLVDLNPVIIINNMVVGSWVQSSALFVAGNQEVGFGQNGMVTGQRALLWNGTASSFIDLHPAGYSSSQANGIGGNQQVGFALASARHAILWTGSSQSAVDLNPVGFSDSEARMTDGEHQVGWGTSSADSSSHALLWTDTAQSAIDLGKGLCFTVNHGRQAGVTETAPVFILWNSSAETAINLSNLLPTNWAVAGGFGGAETPQGPVALDDSGDVFAIVQDSARQYHAVEFVVTSQKASIMRLEGGDIFVQFAGVPNAVNRIEVSPDLSPNSFSTILTVSAGSSGVVAFRDSNSAMFSKRFYRLVSP